MTDNKKVIKNSFLNLCGVLIPAGIMFPFFGYFSRCLTIEEFGIFSISFGLLGYSSLFDAGLSRAVVRLLTIKENIKSSESLIIGTAAVVVTALGMVATILALFYADSLTRVLNISQPLQGQSIFAFQILSLAVMPMLLNLVFTAKLEAYEDFSVFNQLRIINAIISALPSVFLSFLPSSAFIGAVIGITVGRYITLFITIYKCYTFHELSSLRFSKDALNKLLSFGGWISISNIVSPIMVYFDRFILSSVMGAGKVAFYSLPAEFVTRLNIIPSSVLRAAFPALSKLNGSANVVYNDLYKQVKFYYILCATVTIPILILLSDYIVLLWLGEKYLTTSTFILRVLLVGYYFNCLSQLPILYLQSQGITKTIAYLHMAEVIPYLCVLYFFIDSWGVHGAAYAWCMRVIIDNFALTWLSYQHKKMK